MEDTRRLKVGRASLSVTLLLGDGPATCWTRLGIVSPPARKSVAFSEHEHLTLRLLGADEFGKGHVSDEEEDCEGDDDSDVTPLVRVVVLKGQVDVRVSVYHWFTLDRSDGRADAVDWISVGI